jgi:DNA processing protein
MEAAVHSPEDARAWLRLALVPGLTPTMQRVLVEAFGDARRVLQQPRDAITRLIGSEGSSLLERGPVEALLERTLSWLGGQDRQLLTLRRGHYPPMLAEIADPPVVLHAEGDAGTFARECIAIVGSRNATPQGLRDAETFAANLSAAGYAIASGLALGIDAAAHRGGLQGQGGTIAVVGTGLDIVYPQRNRALRDEILRRGCVVSELALGTPPVRVNFPRRNRLISGLARAVLVVEAAPGSGSLITSRCALDQGREVMAIPGSIHSPLARGCNALIKQGAKLVETADDVIAELRHVDAPERPVVPLQPGAPPPHPLLDLMGFSPVTVDQLSEITGMRASRLSSLLSLLLVEGRVSCVAGGWFQRVQRIE